MELTAILTLPRLHEIAAPLYIMFLLGEFLLVRRGVLKGHFLREDTQASLIIGTGSIVSNMLLVLLGGRWCGPPMRTEFPQSGLSGGLSCFALCSTTSDSM